MRASVDDKNFRGRFERHEISPQTFGHREHLRLAYVYLCGSNVDIATDLLRDALKRFLAAHKVPADKYHETMTQAWVQAVRHFMVRAGNTPSFDDFITRDDRLLDSDIMLTHYRRGTLFSDVARTAFIRPDLDPIPHHP